MKSVLILNARFKAIKPEFNDLNFVKAPYGCIMLLEKQKKPDVILKTLKNLNETQKFTKKDICVISIAPHMIEDKGREYMEQYNEILCRMKRLLKFSHLFKRIQFKKKKCKLSKRLLCKN